jgi:hypothetical protein
MDVPWKVILAFVGVFIAGAIFGGVFTIGVSARRFANVPRAGPATDRPFTRLPAAKQPETTVGAGAQSSGRPVSQARANPITPALMKQFTRRLNPSTEQEETLRKILGRAGEDYHRLRQENFAEVARVTERMYADVSGVLTLEQRSELEKMRNQLEMKLQEASRKRAEAAAEAQGRTNVTPGSARPNAGAPRE